MKFGLFFLLSLAAASPIRAQHTHPTQPDSALQTRGRIELQRDVPGTTVMAERRAAIAWTYRPLPRGGEVLISGRDKDAIAAIHAFLAFQRDEHHAHGKTHKH